MFKMMVALAVECQLTTKGVKFDIKSEIVTNFKGSSYIQGVSRLQGITAGGDFLGLCDEKSSYKHVSDFGRLRSYGRFLIPVQALV